MQLWRSLWRAVRPPVVWLGCCLAASSRMTDTKDSRCSERAYCGMSIEFGRLGEIINQNLKLEDRDALRTAGTPPDMQTPPNETDGGTSGTASAASMIAQLVRNSASLQATLQAARQGIPASARTAETTGAACQAL